MDAQGRPAPPDLILIGLRGAGKTAVGRALAARLCREFIDLDERIAAAAGSTIREIFARVGEAEFRRLETVVLTHTATPRDDRPAGEVRPARVISVGGGAVLSDQNRRVLKAAGVCIWLTAPPEELHRRIAADPGTADTRPPLTAAAPLEELRRLLAAREPLYAAVADHVVDTAGRPVGEVVERIMTLLAGVREQVDHSPPQVNG